MPRRNLFRKAVRRLQQAFTLIELLVVIAIIAILVGLLLPAIQKVREAANRMSCQNNLHQIAIASHSYHDSYQAFPYGRKLDDDQVFTWYHQILPFMEQKGIYDGFFLLNLPNAAQDHTPQGSVAPENALPTTQDYVSRSTTIKTFYCPSDTGPIVNEPGNKEWARVRGNYRGSVGSGNYFGDLMPGDRVGAGGNSGRGGFPANCHDWRLNPAQDKGQGTQPALPVGPAAGMYPVVLGGCEFPGIKMSNNNTYGAPMSHSKIADVQDGTSNTIFYSEGLNSTNKAEWGGGMGDQTHGDIGGALFSCYDPPNSQNFDWICRPCPHNRNDQLYIAGPKVQSPYNANLYVTDYCSDGPCGTECQNFPDAWWHEKSAARSHHSGGVNAAMVDGSVRFFSNTINFVTWRQLGTRAGAEPIQVQDVF